MRLLLKCRISRCYKHCNHPDIVSVLYHTATAHSASDYFVWLFHICETSAQRSPQLPSCLINAQPLPAHSPAADDNSLIGCTSHDLTDDLTDDWSLASTHFVDSQYPFRCSFGCVLLLNQMFWKQCTVQQYHSDLSDQSALEIRVRKLG